MEDQLDYSKYKTIIYSPGGYYGSEFLWNDANFAFRHRFEKYDWHLEYGLTQGRDNSDKWQFLTNDREYLAKKLGIDIDVLPEWDYEFCVLDNR